MCVHVCVLARRRFGLGPWPHSIHQNTRHCFFGVYCWTGLQHTNTDRAWPATHKYKQSLACNTQIQTGPGLQHTNTNRDWPATHKYKKGLACNTQIQTGTGLQHTNTNRDWPATHKYKQGLACNTQLQTGLARHVRIHFIVPYIWRIPC